VISGSCHCGAVSFTLRKEPEWLTQCNCSICRRIGGLWAHADVEEIQVVHDPEATIRYVWGDRLLAYHTCRTCGCTTHWENLGRDGSSRMAVNCRMSDPARISSIRVRCFDGADSWTYLD
jgi:hypothetical protein